MAEYIERETLLQTFEEVGGCDAPPDSWADGWDKGISEAIKFVKKLPAADVVEVKHGKWIRPNVPNTRSYKWQCSECGQIAYWLHYGNRGNKNIICKFGYCPNCGARMDGDTK